MITKHRMRTLICTLERLEANEFYHIWFAHDSHHKRVLDLSLTSFESIHCFGMWLSLAGMSNFSPVIFYPR